MLVFGMDFDAVSDFVARSHMHGLYPFDDDARLARHVPN
jgi:hypothetical protein